MDIRSFLAFELPADIKMIVSRVSGDLAVSTLEVRRVRVENIHLTIVFMGNVKAEDIGPIENEVREVCLRYNPFDVSLKEAGVFPNKRNPRVLWIGLQGNSEKMSKFRDELQKSLKAFGIKEEKRKFKPHLTLGRFKDFKQVGPALDEFLLMYKDVTSPVCVLDTLVLFKSELRPGGAQYTKLGSFPLGGNLL